jgi:hypothetical protein
MACVVVNEGDKELRRVAVVLLLHVLLRRALVLLDVSTSIV